MTKYVNPGTKDKSFENLLASEQYKSVPLFSFMTNYDKVANAANQSSFIK